MPIDQTDEAEIVTTRNALILANYNNNVLGISATTTYLEHFFENLIFRGLERMPEDVVPLCVQLGQLMDILRHRHLLPRYGGKQPFPH